MTIIKYYDSKNDLGGIPNRIYNPEGYADALTGAGGPLYKYYRRDHLGNIREVWQPAYSVYIPSRNITQNYTTTTLQRTQFYPSGLPWAAVSGDNPGLQNKKYKAKEFTSIIGIQWVQLIPGFAKATSKAITFTSISTRPIPIINK